MRKTLLSVAILLVLEAAAPASAQVITDTVDMYHSPPPSMPEDLQAQFNLQRDLDVSAEDIASSIPFRYRSAKEQRRAYRIADGFARCAIGFDAAHAAELIDRQSSNGSTIEQEQRYYDRLRNCAQERAEIDRDFMIGALASQLLLKDEMAADIASASSLEELLLFLRSVEVDEGGANNAITSVQLGFECRAAVVPMAAYRVLEQEPDSELESHAMARLVEQTPACNSLMGEHDLGIWFARSYIARGLYHWMRFRQRNPEN